MTSSSVNVDFEFGNMATLFSITLLPLFWVVTQALLVIETEQPVYVKYGSNLTLKCTSDKDKQLQWFEEIRGSEWQRQLIKPIIGGRYITRYLLEEPAGYVNFTLIKMNMQLEDRGMYECEDLYKQNSFALWVTVIYIATEDVEAKEGTDAVYLYCSIRGFDSNLPYMDYNWYYKEQTIMTNHKYDIVYKHGTLQLTVNDPEPADGGEYTCSFVLQTNQGFATFFQTVILNTQRLPDSSGQQSSVMKSGWLLAVIMTLFTSLVPRSFCAG